MATKFKKGDAVKVNAVLPQGPVEALRMTEDGEFFYMISWTDADGKTLVRWFKEEDLVAA
jgi:hypothetical protein